MGDKSKGLICPTTERPSERCSDTNCYGAHASVNHNGDWFCGCGRMFEVGRQSPVVSAEVATIRQKFIAAMRELNGRYPEPETGMWPPATERSTPRLLNELEDAFDKLASLQQSPVSPQQETEKPSRYFFDTEFMEAPGMLVLLSIGIVSGDGRRSFYAVNADADHSLANDWVRTNVLPHLNGPHLTQKEIATQVCEWIGDDTPEFWGYYADYDWVAFCWLFGAMVDLPKGWPMYCRDIKQLADSLGNPKLPEQTSAEHNALNDALWNREAFNALVTRSSVTIEPDRKEQDKNCPVCTGHDHIGHINRDVAR